MSPSQNDVIEANKHEAMLFCLPSITTHELQRLNVAVFRALEHYCNVEVFNFWRLQPNKAFTKELYGKIFAPVWSKTTTISNIHSCLKQMWNFLSNDNAIPNHAFAPSDVTNQNASSHEMFPEQPSTRQEISTKPSISQDMSPHQLINAEMPAQPSKSCEASPQPSTSREFPCQQLVTI